MKWNDVGFLLSKNRYNENSIIAEFFTENHGKTSGIIFGGSSMKIKNYLQIGNKIHINYNSKSEDRLGYFKIEIFKAYTPLYFDNKKKLLCISSAMNLVKLLTAEAQENINIFKIMEYFFLLLEDENWIKKYIFWELNFLKIIGYDLELNKITNFEILDKKKLYFVKSSTEKKIVPNFLIEDEIKNEILTNDILYNGLKLVGDYLEKNILKPNSIMYPNTRLEFINLFK